MRAGDFDREGWSRCAGKSRCRRAACLEEPTLRSLHTQTWKARPPASHPNLEGVQPNLKIGYQTRKNAVSTSRSRCPYLEEVGSSHTPSHPNLEAPHGTLEPNLEDFRRNFAALVSKFGRPSFTTKLGKLSPPFHVQIWKAIVSCDVPLESRIPRIIVSLHSLTPKLSSLHDKTYRQVVIGRQYLLDFSTSFSVPTICLG